MSTTDNRLRQLRIVTWLEGLSYIVLLFIAMPMKYIGGDPSLVRTVGMLHGVLFVLFVFALLQAKIEQEWPGRRALRVFGTTFIPFGMLLFDRAVASPGAGPEVHGR